MSGTDKQLITDKQLMARIAAHESWARTADRAARTANARAAFILRFENEVDPTGALSPADRTLRAAHLRKAYYSRLALKSSQARRKARGDVSA